jgi:hypothetical protein
LHLKWKSDAFGAFQTYKAFAKNKFQAQTKDLQDDKGGEFIFYEFIKFNDKCDINRHHSTQNRLQQNSIAERANRTIADAISAMLY